MQQISDNVYVETGFQGCNVSFVTTSEGVVMIDTPMRPSEAVKWRQEIAQKGGIRYLINTEHHVDHIFGNYFFSATVISHKGIREAFAASLGPRDELLERIRQMDPGAASVVDLNKYEPTPATITFSHQLSLYVGEHVFELIHLVGHTPNQTAVYLPKEKVVFPGDNVVTVPPFFRESFPVRWVESLKVLESLDADLIVPGHGEVCGKKGIQDLSAFLQAGIDAVRKAIEQGLSKEETAARVSAFSRFPLGPAGVEVDPERQQEGITRIYEELTG